MIHPWLDNKVTDRCVQEYNDRTDDTTDYSPRWNTWPPMNGVDPLTNNTDESLFLYHDSFKHKSVG